ncbi:hypothetical protein [Capnocytophaga sp. oral taxon 335]|uniref:hypothetical protein n=1 Tax=Capnocytophaga sp. oral taxon 335 TaxID=712215 RepID=UPI0005535D84|nr:hypothetical protein [Capnocytophaga sp. oral taxon 335]
MTNNERTMNEQMTVQIARADRKKTKKTSPLHIPSFRWLPPKGELQRRKDEQKTNKRRTMNEQKTNKRRTMNEQMTNK